MPNFFIDIINKMKKYSEIIVAFAVIGIIGLIMMPMPSWLLDILLVLNITLGIMILLLTLFTTNVLQFSSFPTLLLVTTMFRLGLNISSTRLILSDGDAGNVINAFAEFVTGNNYIVGAVIFIIIVVVQMVVVTSGSSRVSEVSARFTLDAMPGKQMAIDADLNSGLITEEQAKKRRIELQREADFYGAMDGASKFVKGDAIAGIIITLINLLGGILIFSMKENLGVMEALDKFGKLTIGDGLVSQIPALLISVASGILVTRSDTETSFGESVTQELFNFSKVILVTSVVLFIIGLVPGFPTVPFFLISIIMGAVGYLLFEEEKREKQLLETNKFKEEELEQIDLQNDYIETFQVEPISLEIGYGLIPIVDESIEGNLTGHITQIRRQVAKDMGIILNPIRIRDNLQLNPNEYVIKIKGNIVASGYLYLDKYLVIDPGTDDFEIAGIPAKEPAFNLDAIWIEEKDREYVDLRGFTVVEPVIVLVTHLKEVIKDHSFELIGRQEVKELLETIKDDYNVVIDELIPDILSLGEVQKVLQSLLKEKVPVNDLVTILETLADNATMTKDMEVLTEYVRSALGRTIVKEYLNHEGILQVITIDPELEDILGKNIQKTIQGSIPILKPDMITAIFDSINTNYNTLLGKGIKPVILASPNIRISFRNLTYHNFREIPILSLNEVPNDINIEAVGMIG
ncbi:MAG TPA: flagellar biosynthesis protein FlhA [Tissierellaceae bacterium]